MVTTGAQSGCWSLATAVFPKVSFSACETCQPACPGELHPLFICPAGRAQASAGEKTSVPTTPFLHRRDGPLWHKDVIQHPVLLYRDANKRASCARGLEVFFKNNNNKSLNVFSLAQLTSTAAHHLLKPLCQVLGWWSPGWPCCSPGPMPPPTG